MKLIDEDLSYRLELRNYTATLSRTKVEVAQSAWKIFVGIGRDRDEEGNYKMLLRRMSKFENKYDYKSLNNFSSSIGERPRVLYFGWNQHEDFRNNHQQRQGYVETRIFAHECKFLAPKMC